MKLISISKKAIIRTLLVSLYLSILIPSLNAQKYNLFKEFKNISRPEKWWVIFHPFIAKKTLYLTKESLWSADSLKKTDILDGNISGGQVDAFKHSYWMALLTQSFKWRKAWKLGKAHEKGNYITFKKGIKRGKENLPDKISSEMDLWNNLKGIEIGLDNKNSSRTQLQEIIIDSIQSGNMKKLKKDSSGKFLDCEGNVIPNDSLKGKWINNKCLVPSDFHPI